MQLLYETAMHLQFKQVSLKTALMMKDMKIKF